MKKFKIHIIIFIMFTGISVNNISNAMEKKPIDLTNDKNYIFEFEKNFEKTKPLENKYNEEKFEKNFEKTKPLENKYNEEEFEKNFEKTKPLENKYNEEESNKDEYEEILTNKKKYAEYLTNLKYFQLSILKLLDDKIFAKKNLTPENTSYLKNLENLLPEITSIINKFTKNKADQKEFIYSYILRCVARDRIILVRNNRDILTYKEKIKEIFDVWSSKEEERNFMLENIEKLSKIYIDLENLNTATLDEIFLNKMQTYLLNIYSLFQNKTAEIFINNLKHFNSTNTFPLDESDEYALKEIIKKYKKFKNRIEKLKEKTLKLNSVDFKNKLKYIIENGNMQNNISDNYFDPIIETNEPLNFDNKENLGSYISKNSMDLVKKYVINSTANSLNKKIYEYDEEEMFKFISKNFHIWKVILEIEKNKINKYINNIKEEDLTPNLEIYKKRIEDIYNLIDDILQDF